MSRVAFCQEQKVEHKLKDFKKWVKKQMAAADKTQKDVGDALGISQGMVSQMLKVPKNKKEEREVQKDPFSYGQVLILCDFFEVGEEEKKKILTI